MSAVSTRVLSIVHSPCPVYARCVLRFFSSFTHPPPDGAVAQRLLPPPYPSDDTSRPVDHDEFSSRLVLDRHRLVGQRPMSSSSAAAISSSFQTSWSTMTKPDNEDDSTNVPLNLTKRPTVSGGRAVCWQSPDDITSTLNTCVTSTASFWKPNSMQSSLSLPPWKNCRGSSTCDADSRGHVGGCGVQQSDGRGLESSPCLRREQRQPFSSGNKRPSYGSEAMIWLRRGKLRFESEPDDKM